jgi:hypothetical protein
MSTQKQKPPFFSFFANKLLSKFLNFSIIVLFISGCLDAYLWFSIRYIPNVFGLFLIPSYILSACWFCASGVIFSYKYGVIIDAI